MVTTSSNFDLLGSKSLNQPLLLVGNITTNSKLTLSDVELATVNSKHQVNSQFKLKNDLLISHNRPKLAANFENCSTLNLENSLMKSTTIRNKLLTTQSKPLNCKAKSLLNSQLQKIENISNKSLITSYACTNIRTTNSLVNPFLVNFTDTSSNDFPVSTTNYDLKRKLSITSEPKSKTIKKNNKKEKVLPEKVQPLPFNDVKLQFPKFGVKNICFPTIEEIENIKYGSNKINAGKRVKGKEKDIIKIKIEIVALASQSIINSPVWFDTNDLTRSQLKTLAVELASYDPEFVLKTALYTRDKLNIRTAGNFLLALAAFIENCRPYLKKYFNTAIRLPSDWIQVAEFYQSIAENFDKMKLPAGLRKVMINKFPDFDEYQLGKYNKNTTKSNKKKKLQSSKDNNSSKNKKQNSQVKSDKNTDTVMVGEDNSASRKFFVPRYTLKYLIQKLHIVYPAYNVMCLLGKKYPDESHFNASKLPGIFEPEKEGTRMKLKTPETWETMVSLNGNNAQTWENLLDNRKLPFMAMLRNIRNMIKAGISEKHHNKILKLLGNENAIARSRQFPFRFFSAFEILDELLANLTKFEKYKSKGIKPFLNNEQKSILSRQHFGMRHEKSEEEKAIDKMKKYMHRNFSKAPLYDENIIQRYRKALNESVKISTQHNVIPISGRTIVLCDINFMRMDKPCGTAKGLGKPRKLYEIGILLGLMCAYSCESCKFMVFIDNNKHKVIEIEANGILSNLGSIVDLCQTLNSLDNSEESISFMPFKYLCNAIVSKEKFDNIVIISSQFSSDQSQKLCQFIEKYRNFVKDDAMGYEISLSSKKCSLQRDNIVPFYIKFSGFSEQALQYIALRDQHAQINEIEVIDKSYHLKDVKENKIRPERVDPDLTIANDFKPWKVIKVFISSTFKDTQSERNYLVQFVFPELRKQLTKEQIHITEIDLRWGITKQNSSYKNVLACLTEVKKCDIFIALLGQRYGWIPNDFTVTDEDFSWLESYPSKRSITELEIQQAFRDKKPCLFFIRNETIYQNIPQAYKQLFVDKDKMHIKKLKALKQSVCASGYPVMKNYNCDWDNTEKQITGLEGLGDAIIENVLNETEKFHLQDKGDVDIINNRSTIITRKFSSVLYSQILAENTCKEGKVVILHGKPGSGKTVIMKQAFDLIGLDNSLLVQYTNVSTSKIIDNANDLLKHLCKELSCSKIPTGEEISNNDFTSFKDLFVKQLNMLTKVLHKKVFIFVDGINELDIKFGKVDWIPKLIPGGCTLIVSCRSNSDVYKSLKLFKNVKYLNLPNLNFAESRKLVATKLKFYSKALDESSWNNQMTELLNKADAKNPQYLQSACDLLRNIATFENITDTIRKLPKFLDEMLMHQLFEVERLMGKTSVVDLVSALIFCSVDQSITENDLINALAFYNSKISKGMIYSVLYLLKPFFTRKNFNNVETITFASNLHYEIVKKKLSGSVEICKIVHALLASYYTDLYNLSRNEEDISIPVRCLSNIPYHMALSGQMCKLEELLMNVDYLFTKFNFGIGDQLRKDFEIYLNNNAQEKLFNIKKLLELQEFSLKYAAILSKNPNFMFQLALDESNNSILTSWISDRLIEEQFKHPSLKDVNFVIVELLKEKNISLLHDCVNIGETYDSPKCIDVHKDFDLVAIGFVSGKAIIYNKKSGTIENIWFAQYQPVTALLFDNEHLVATSANGRISVWHVIKRHQMFSSEGHSKYIAGLVFQPMSQDKVFRHFATISHDRSIKLWSCAFDKLKEIKTIKTNGIIGNSIDFHPIFPKIVAGMWDATLRIWDVNSEKKLAVLRGHEHSVSSAKFSMCGDYIASCSVFEPHVRLWSTKYGTCIGKFNDGFLQSPKMVTFSEGNLLHAFGKQISNDQIHSVVTWNSNLGLKQALMKTTGEISNALCLKYIGDKNVICVGFHNGKLAIYDIENELPYFEEIIHSANITCIDFIKIMSSVYVITGSGDSLLKATNLTEMTCENAVFKGHDDMVLDVSCTNEFIVSGSKDCCICIWLVADFVTAISQEENKVVPVKKLTKHEAPVSCISFKPDYSIFLSACRNGNLAFWDKTVITETGRKKASRFNVHENVPLHLLEKAHLDWITCCSWNEDGSFCATGSNDATIKLWNVQKIINKETKKPQFVLKGHNGGITSLCYQLGSIISTGGDDCTIRVWSQKGYLVTSLKCENRTNACAFIVKVKPEVVENLNFSDSDSNEEMDWSVIVDIDEWDERHTKNTGGKRRQKYVKEKENFKIEDFEIASVGNNAEIVIWKPLVGDRKRILNECKSEIAAMTFKTDTISLSSDGSLCTWNNGSNLELIHNSKVTCMLQITSSLLITSCDFGFIYLWNAQTKNLIQKRMAHTNSVIHLENYNKSQDMFNSVDVNGTIITWKMASDQNSFFKISEKMLEPEEMKTTERLIPLEDFSWVIGSMKKQDGETIYCTDKGKTLNNGLIGFELDIGTFLTCIVKYKEESNIYFLGDNNGFIYKFPSLEKERLHDGKISCMVLTERFLVTASDDCTIKIWKIPDFKQVGQYFCSHPVSVMNLDKDLQEGIICGDLSGNLYTLLFHEMKL